MLDRDSKSPGTYTMIVPRNTLVLGNYNLYLVGEPIHGFARARLGCFWAAGKGRIRSTHSSAAKMNSLGKRSKHGENIMANRGGTSCLSLV